MRSRAERILIMLVNYDDCVKLIEDFAKQIVKESKKEGKKKKLMVGLASYLRVPVFSTTNNSPKFDRFC